MAEIIKLPCIFCHKKVSTVTCRYGDGNSPKFLQLFAQYLDIQIKTRIDISDGDLLSCDDCFILVNSFCDLFVQWENLRLQLDWMVRQLFEVMRTAKIVSSSHTELRYQCQNEEGFDMNVVFQKVQKLVNELLNGSAKHLSSSLPKLVLKKIPVEEDEESEGVIGNTLQSDGETEFDNSGLPNCQSNSNEEVYEERQVEAEMVDRIEEPFSLKIIDEQEAIDASKAVTLIDKEIETDHLVDDELKDKDDWGEIPRSQGGDVIVEVCAQSSFPNGELFEAGMTGTHDNECIGEQDTPALVNGTTSLPITIDKTDKNQELVTNSGLGRGEKIYDTHTKDELMAFLAILHLSLPLHPKAVVPKNYHKKRRRKKRTQLNATEQVTTDVCASNLCVGNPTRHSSSVQNELDEQGRLPNSSLNAEQLLVEDGDRETQLVDRIQENISLKMMNESDAVLASEAVSFADKQIQTDQLVYNNSSEFVKGWDEAANAQDYGQSSSKLTDKRENGTVSDLEKVKCCKNERLTVSKSQQKSRAIWVENQQLQIDLPSDYENSDVEYELEIIVKVEEMESPPPNEEFQVEDEMIEMDDHQEVLLNNEETFKNNISSRQHPDRDMEKEVQTRACASNRYQPNDDNDDEIKGLHSQVTGNNAQDSSSVPNEAVEVDRGLNPSLDGEQNVAMVEEASTVSTLKCSQVNEQISQEAVEVGRENDKDQVEAELTSMTDDAFPREIISEQEVVSVGESSLTSNFSGAEKPITHLTCPICSTAIDSPFLLTLHLRCFHKIKIPFKCPLCKHECPTTPLFNQHMKRAHGTVTALIGTFQCSICLESFSTLKFLKIHKFRIHKRPQCGPNQIKRKNEKGTHKKKSSTKIKQDLEMFGKSSFSRAGRNSVIAKLAHDDDERVPELGASVEIESHNEMEPIDQFHDTILQTDNEIKASEKDASPYPSPSYVFLSTYDNATGGHPNKNASAKSYTPVQDHNYSRVEAQPRLEPCTETNESVLMNETQQHKIRPHDKPGKLATIAGESSSPRPTKNKESQPVASSSSSSSLASSSSAKKLPTTCHVCGSTFKTPVLLTLHLRSMHSQLQTPFKCPYCSYQCRVSSGYKIHMRLVHNTTSGLPGLYRCKTCKERFDHRQVLYKHTRVHQKNHPQQPTGLKCGICSQLFKTEAKLLVHTSSCRRFKCSFATCSKSFTYKNDLKKHEWTHTEKVKQNKPRSWSYRRRKGFHCLWPHCGSKFFSASSLHSHVNLKHEGNETPPPPPSNECHDCQIQFDSPALLALHLTCHEKRVDGLPDANGREEPGASEQHSQALESLTIEKEMQTGSPKIVDVFSLSNGELPLPFNVQDARQGPSTFQRKCHKCPSSFESRVLLTLHLRSAHQSKSRFKCPQCRARIFNSTNFRDHMNLVHKTVSGLPGRLQCQVCKERFCHRRALAKHVQVHPASFKCEKCREDYETQAQLQLHHCQFNEELQTTTVQNIAPPLASSTATSTTSMENNYHESPQPVNPQRPRNRKSNLKESGSTYTKRGPV